MHQHWWTPEDGYAALRRRLDEAIAKASAEPPWHNAEEDDQTPTSSTAFELLGVVLGNTLGFDLKPLLAQTQALKQLESSDD